MLADLMLLGGVTGSCCILALGLGVVKLSSSLAEPLPMWWKHAVTSRGAAAPNVGSCAASGTLFLEFL